MSWARSGRNGKKKRIPFRDFKTALKTLSVDEVVQDRIFEKFRKVRPVLERLIDRSFLDKERQAAYKELIMKRYLQIRMDT
jgi:serine/threonine-protein kinase HipA